MLHEGFAHQRRLLLLLDALFASVVLRAQSGLGCALRKGPETDISHFVYKAARQRKGAQEDGHAHWVLRALDHTEKKQHQESLLRNKFCKVLQGKRKSNIQHFKESFLLSGRGSYEAVGPWELEEK